MNLMQSDGLGDAMLREMRDQCLQVMWLLVALVVPQCPQRQLMFRLPRSFAAAILTKPWYLIGHLRRTSPALSRMDIDFDVAEMSRHHDVW